MADGADTHKVVMLTDLLEQLREVSAPAPISMWPQTWGWLAVSLAILGMLGWYGWRRYRHYRDNAYRREALADLADMTRDPAAIALLVRRVALSAYPRSQVAALTGDEWLDFLASHSGSQEFPREQWRQLITAPYRPVEFEADFSNLACRWIQQHEAGGPT